MQTITAIATPLFLVISAILALALVRARQQIKETEKRLSLEQELEEIKNYLAVADGFYDSVLEADITNNVLIGSSSAKETALHGIPQDATYSECMKVLMQKFVKEEYRSLYHFSFDREKLLKRYAQGERKFNFEFEKKTGPDQYCWMRVTVCIYYSETDKAVKIIAYIKNIQEEKKRELHLLQIASTDYLTGLYNKRATEMLICSVLSDHRQLSANHALIIVDIDNFKQINDATGHTAGDHILHKVAELLKKQFRQSDIVGRIGGDEFAILMKNYKSVKSVAERIKKLLEMTAVLEIKGSEDIPLSLSIGIALYPEQADNYSDLFAVADAAMYHVKRSGRNGYYLYDDLSQIAAIISGGRRVAYEQIRPAH